nr:hypothetical protein [Tanacetum cinerariifolium]
MTGVVPHNPPVILLSDKLQVIHTRVLVLLDVDEMNYSSWMYFFQNLCRGYNILTHILGEEPTDAPTSSVPPLKIMECHNKRSRSIALKAKLRSMKLGDLSTDAYFRKIESIATILSSLGSPVSNNDVVNIALDGLPEKYQHVSDTIIHRDTFLDLKMVRSMLTTAEMRLKSWVTYVNFFFVVTYSFVG